MEKPSKAEAHYKYPTQCCGYCRHSYVNTYDGYQCRALSTTELIDVGGVCDLFEGENQ